MDLLSASSTMMLAFISHPSIHRCRVWMLREMSSRDVQVKSSGVEPQVRQSSRMRRAYGSLMKTPMRGNSATSGLEPGVCCWELGYEQSMLMKVNQNRTWLASFY